MLCATNISKVLVFLSSTTNTSFLIQISDPLKSYADNETRSAALPTHKPQYVTVTAAAYQPGYKQNSHAPARLASRIIKALTEPINSRNYSN